jgi:hypothetical protein
MIDPLFDQDRFIDYDGVGLLMGRLHEPTGTHDSIISHLSL